MTDSDKTIGDILRIDIMGQRSVLEIFEGVFLFFPAKPGQES